MQFVVPQFIERKAKILGPLTFKQFAFVGITGLLCIFIFFTMPFSQNVKIAICVFLLGLGGALAFVKVGKDPLPVVLKNFFFFMIGQRVYLWKKRAYSPPVFAPSKKEERIASNELGNENNLSIASNSRLKKLATHIETKLK